MKRDLDLILFRRDRVPLHPADEQQPNVGLIREVKRALTVPAKLEFQLFDVRCVWVGQRRQIGLHSEGQEERSSLHVDEVFRQSPEK